MRLSVNGVDHEVEGAEPWESLLFVLRERLGLYGTKNACEQGECGSCSVLVDGVVVCSCLVPVVQAEERSIVTVEGLDDDPLGALVRDKLAEAGGVQCGFCTPGFVVTATAMVRESPGLTADSLAEGLAGNLCRCTGYRKILDAIDAARSEWAAERPLADEALR